MTQPSGPDAVSEQEAEALIERLQRDELSEQDKAVITKVIRSYLYLALMVQQTGAKPKTVRQFLLGNIKKKTKTRTQQRTLTSRTTIRPTRLTPQRIKRSI